MDIAEKIWLCVFIGGIARMLLGKNYNNYVETVTQELKNQYGNLNSFDIMEEIFLGPIDGRKT